MSSNYDLAIIGAGPVGLFAASFANLHGLSVALFDSLASLGGQPAHLYPFKEIADIPVFSKIAARDLINRLHANISAAATHIYLNERITKIDQREPGFLLNNKITCQAVLLTTGNGSFQPKKFPISLDNDQLVHYFVRQPEKFADQEVAVFGGGDSALDWALELAKYAKKVTLIHRREVFRGLESSVAKLKQTANVDLLTPYLPKAGTVSQNKVEISLKKLGQEQLVKTRFDNIVVAYGFKADNRLARNWGLELAGQHLKVNSEMQTNLPGIYAAGDAVSYPGHVPVIGLGFGEAQIAITSIMRQLFPEKTLTIHSTSI